MHPISDHIRVLEHFAASEGITLWRLPMAEWQLGQVRGNHIRLRAGLIPEQELPTLVHELTHWLVHRAVCTASERTIWEYEAEAVEAFVLGRLGLPNPFNDESGLTAADSSDALLAQSKQRVVFASNRICAALGLPSAAEE
jgi:hypothetical protein